jgi:hypothetical protein
VKRILLFGLLAGVMVASTGCGLFQSMCCYDRGSCGPCYGGDPCSCGAGCDDGCGPACGGACRRPFCDPVGSYRPRRAAMAVCDDECDPCGRPCGRAAYGGCDPCADPCCTSPCRVWHRGPLSCLFALFMPNTWCGPSCGRRYWGDFYSDPPDCWDPCDGYGNYAGVGGGTGGGCRSCGGSHKYTQNYPGDEGDYVRGDYSEGRPVSRGGDNGYRGDRTVTPAPRPMSGTPHPAPKRPTE